MTVETAATLDDATLFPLTGYGSMDKAEWLRHLGIRSPIELPGARGSMNSVKSPLS